MTNGMLFLLQLGLDSFSHPLMDGALLLFLIKTYRDHVTQGASIKSHRVELETKLAAITEKVDVIHDWWLGNLERRAQKHEDSIDKVLEKSAGS